MGENSKIEWCDNTFNPWVGCQKVSPGCDHCYAEGWAKRSGLVQWGPHAERRRTRAENWRKPLTWAKGVRGTRKRPRVFCASLADWLDNKVPQTWRDDLAGLIYDTPELDWLLLTKRIENYAELAPAAWRLTKPPGNVWLGVTAEDQKHYDRRWKILSAIPATVRFISHEPALGTIYDITGDVGQKPDWITMGGESGGHARPMPDARLLRDVCAVHGIPFFFKQMPEKKAIPDDLMVRQFPRVSLKAEAA